MIKLNSCYIFDIIETEIMNTDIKNEKKIVLPIYTIVNKEIMFLSNYIIKSHTNKHS